MTCKAHLLSIALLPAPKSNNTFLKEASLATVDGQEHDLGAFPFHHRKQERITGRRPEAMAQGILVKKGQKLVNKKRNRGKGRELAALPCRDLNQPQFQG